MSGVERWLASQMGERLNQAAEEMILSGQPATTTSTAAATASQSLNVDDLLRRVEHMRAEQRWLYGRPVRAMKVGRIELRYVRASCQPAPGSLFSSLTMPGDHCWGIPCYEVVRHSYYEPIYEDEAPTLEALNERLMQDPPAMWGEVVTG
jgi:hypothetical protein